MIADNCCRKSSNRPLVAVVATGETAGVGQTAKNPVRACVFRFALNSCRDAERCCWIAAHRVFGYVAFNRATITSLG
jgi:hypothetical protein